MPYHLKDHIYLSQFRDDLILLDTRRDNYTICFKQASELLIKLLIDNSEIVPQDESIIQKFIDSNIIEKKDTLYPFYIDRKMDSEGVANVDWRLPLGNENARFNFQVLRAFKTLLQVNFHIKFGGLYGIIQFIKRSKKNHITYTLPQHEELKKLADEVNKACLIYPTRTKCLEWAITYVLLALKRNWKCNLEIGVQNYPFFAHAWVECDGKIVMDSADLRNGLAIILNEPFRKSKT